MKLQIKGKNYNKLLSINKRLTINNLKATIEYDHKKITTLWVEGKQLNENSCIGAVLTNNDTVTVIEQDVICSVST